MTDKEIIELVSAELDEWIEENEFHEGNALSNSRAEYWRGRSQALLDFKMFLENEWIPF